MKKIAIASLSVLLMLTGCSEDPVDMDGFYKVYGDDSTSMASLMSSVAAETFLFGHQSVGNNILSGVEHWEGETGVSLNRISARDLPGNEEPVFADFKVGANGDPTGKVDDFVSVIDQIPADRNCTAFFKFCYVDVTENTEVEEVFGYFREQISQLAERNPHVRIVLFTVPLTTVQSGFKAAAKKVLSRKPAGFNDNLQRAAFNELLLEEFEGELPVFDLARVESTLPSGKRSTFSSEGKEYSCLAELYSSDGGHLNDQGSQIAAYNLLAFLAGLE